MADLLLAHGAYILKTSMSYYNSFGELSNEALAMLSRYGYVEKKPNVSLTLTSSLHQYNITNNSYHAELNLVYDISL